MLKRDVQEFMSYHELSLDVGRIKLFCLDLSGLNIIYLLKLFYLSMNRNYSKDKSKILFFLSPTQLKASMSDTSHAP